MKLSDITPGTKLEIEISNYEGDRGGPVLVSELEWIDEGETAYIAAPIHEGIVYPVRIASPINIYFLHKGDLYRCSARVLERSTKDNIALLKIEKTGGIERIQRRQFFRFECTLPVKYRIIETLECEKNEGIPFLSTYLRDLSGGGISLAVEDKIEKGSLIECLLSLDPQKVINFYGRIVRVSRQPPEEKYKYTVGIIFYKIENRDREEIIRFIFREQRKLRKKGLI